MKRLYRALSLILAWALAMGMLTGFTSADAQEVTVLASVNRSGQVTRYYYNEDAQVMLRREVYPKQNVDTLFTYHANGTVASETTTDTLGTSVICYDTHGSLTAKSRINASGMEIPEFTYTNSYDSKDRLTKSVRSDPAGLSQETISYVYNADGSFQATYETGHFEGSEFVPYIRKSATFDKDGNLTRQQVDYEFGEQISRQYEILRNAQGDITETRLRQNWKPFGTDKFESRYTYYQHTYDADGKLLTTVEKRTDYRNESGKETKSSNRLISKTSYTYDSQGQPVQATTTNASGIPAKQVVWDFDDQGRMILERTTDLFMGTTQDNLWSYDQEGRLTQRKGTVTMSDLDFFLYGTGSQTYEVDEEYTYRPLSKVIYAQ